jgi:hypothetical protein
VFNPILDSKALAVDEDRARWERNLRFSTTTVDIEDEYRHDFTIMCNGKCLIVTVYLTPSPEDLITRLLSQYNNYFWRKTTNTTYRTFKMKSRT